MSHSPPERDADLPAPGGAGNAIVILGGLITSTVLNLLVLPTLALKFGRFTTEAIAP